jgi:chemotaxis protein CheZ
MPIRVALSLAEFNEIEAALRASEKGRAFLALSAERAQSVSLAATREMLRHELQEIRGRAQASAEQTHIQILRQELQEMSACIQQTRTEIAALRPTDAGHNRIMAATGELDAIVSATERATSTILNSAERIQAAVEKIPVTEECAAAREEIESEAIEILMACSFQDITGQRTTKVVNTLRYLEQRVNAMIEIWGIREGLANLPRPHETEDARPDAHLLNGPALEGGVSQADVDALLAGLEPALAPTPVAEPAREEPARVEQARPEPSRPAPASPAPAARPAEVANVNTPAVSSQDDIDALFA